MKKKRQIFSGRLFAEGMRQVKWIGVIGTALLVLLAFLRSHAVSGTSFSTYTVEYDGEISEYLKMMFSASLVINCTYLATMVHLIFVPVMMFALLGFLHRRKAGDFYGSAPAGRRCLYLSYLAAVFVWTMAALLVVFAAVYGFGAVFFRQSSKEADAVCGLIQSSLPDFLRCLWKACAGVVLAVGAMAVAISVTGSTFSSTIAFFMILFAPRLLVDLAVRGCHALLPIAPVSPSLERILNPACQVCYNEVFSMKTDSLMGPVSVLGQFFSNYDIDAYLFRNFDAYSSCAEWVPVLYTAVLGLLYLILGGVLFERHRFEQAGQVGVNGGVLTAFRILMSLLFTLPATFGLCVYFLQEEPAEISALGIAVLYAAGIGVYFLWELVPLCKGRKAFQKAGWFLAVLLANGAFLAAVAVNAKKLFTTLPAANDIEAVSIDFGQADPGAFLTGEFPEGIEKLRKVKLTGEGIRQPVADALDEQVKQCRESIRGYIFRNYSNEKLVFTIYYRKDNRIKKISRTLSMDYKVAADIIESIEEELRGKYPTACLLPITPYMPRTVEVLAKTGKKRTDYDLGAFIRQVENRTEKDSLRLDAILYRKGQNGRLLYGSAIWNNETTKKQNWGRNT